VFGGGLEEGNLGVSLRCTPAFGRVEMSLALLGYLTSGHCSTPPMRKKPRMNGAPGRLCCVGRMGEAGSLREWKERKAKADPSPQAEDDKVVG
jgi:hypothetical protein